MRKSTLFAIFLIVLGIAAFTYQGITYKTRGETVDMGALQVTTETKHHIPLPPLVGVIAIIGGIALLIRNDRGMY